MKRTATHQAAVLGRRSSSAATPIPARKVRKQATRSGRKAAAIKEQQR